MRSADLRAVIEDQFGSAFFEELGLNCEIKKCKLRDLTKRFLVMIALLARAFGSNLSDTLRDGANGTTLPTRWNCVNAHSICGGKATIESFDVESRRAWFSCPICKLTYARPYPLLYDEKIMFPKVARGTEQRIIRQWHRFPGNVRRIRAIEHVRYSTIFSVTTYTVDSRMTEFGVRLALGSTPSQLNHLVIRRGIAATVAGIVAGIAGAFGLTRLMKSMLFGTSSYDPSVYAAVALVLFASSVVACWIPARRAAQVDIARLLKSE
jgi:hypothetical protein